MKWFKKALVVVGCAASLWTANSALAGGIAADDEVIFWNNVLLDEFRLDYGTGCPCPLARAGAMVQAAVYEAVNSIDRTHEPYVAFIDAPHSAMKDAAVAAAAYRTMMALFPNSQAYLTTQYNNRKALMGGASRAKNDGIRVGNAAANQILEHRADDGSDQPETYVFGGRPGDYTPSPPQFNGECNPEWGLVTPFCMTSPTQFRPRGPLGYTSMDKLLKSAGYAAQLNEVKELGRRYGSSRTDEQTQIAFFWANDKNGTYKPPGHLFHITQIVSHDQGLTLEENARLFALVGLAMGDAGIVAWDAKYKTNIDLWRPIVAIRRAQTDGNPLTEAQKNWTPLNPFTPPFPAWISGHATFGAAHAAIMAEFFGTDNITFTADSEDPFYNELPSHPTRTFHSFSEAAIENGLSRVYLGVHYRMDAADGNAAGFMLGHYVGQNFLKRLCIADFNKDGNMDVADMYDFYAAYSTADSDADVNGDSNVDSGDMVEFMNAYLGGC